MGPCGGPGGDRIVKVILWHAGAVDAISVSYERGGRIEQTEYWGKPEGRQRSEVILLIKTYSIHHIIPFLDTSFLKGMPCHSN